MLDESQREGALPEGDLDTSVQRNAESTANEETSIELPTEVKAKLRKLDRLEGRYQELLRAYRTAHSRVQLIEPFEASLRESTPLASISDPGAFTEYLNQLNLKGDMVLDELKRVSADRDDWKRKSEEAEKSAESAREELDATKRSKETPANGVKSENEGRPSLEVSTADVGGTGETPQQSASAQSPTPSQSSRVASFSLFSPKSKAVKSPPMKPASEDFFSYDTEVPRLESELSERQQEIDSLKKQLESMKKDLAVTRESTESMVQSLESATRELHSLRDGKDKYDSDKSALQQEVTRLEAEYTRISGEKDELQRTIDGFEFQNSGEARREVESSQKRIEELESELKSTTNLIEDLKRRLEESDKATKDLRDRLIQKEDTVKDLEDSLALAKSDERQRAATNPDDESSNKRVETLNGVLATLRSQLKDAENELGQLRQLLESQRTDFEKAIPVKVYETLHNNLKAEQEWTMAQGDAEKASQFLLQRIATSERKSESTLQPSSPLPVPDGASAGSSNKKRNKKKKRGKGGQDHISEVPVKVTEDIREDEETETPKTPSDQATHELKTDIEDLQNQINEKNASIDRLAAKLKDQDSLKEEIETLRDDLLQQGEEHVEARDKLKAAVVEKQALQESIQGLEKELAKLKAEKVTGTADSEKAHQELMTEFEEFKAKTTTLQTDLNATQQLASARFKDISDLRDLLSKAQPELRKLRQENKDLISAKDELKNKTGELHRLESRHEDLKAEMKSLSKRLGDQDSEIKKFQQETTTLTTARSKAEEDLQIARSDLRAANTSRQSALDAQQSTQKDLSKAKEETQDLRKKLRAIEDQITQLTASTQTLQDEIQLKSAQHASAESLMSSMRDQTAELSTQMREATTRASTLEDELSETQRMLSERSREGETMRRLLNDVEGSSERKVREMKERMESAVEERDRAEDEASTTARRMARELEDLRSKVREAVRGAKRAEDERDELEGERRTWRKRREELEGAAEGSAAEVGEVRSAMERLREALDEAERQVQELERGKGELRKWVEEGEKKVERLRKKNEKLANEVKTLQQQQNPARKPPQDGSKVGVGAGAPGSGLDSGAPSSRSSTDSHHQRPPSRALGSSPLPRDRTTLTGGPTPTPAPAIDYVYLKNVLLQFLEQRDKNHQKQLVPVLGMLLHFDR